MKPLGGDAAREIGTFTLKTKGDKPQEVAGKYVVGLGEDRRAVEAGNRHLECGQVGLKRSVLTRGASQVVRNQLVTVLPLSTDIALSTR